MKQKRARWRKLDNAAKLFLAASTKRDTRVFRFYCELKEEVDREILQKALDQTIETYPVFLSVIRKGLFWCYLEMSSLHPEVKEEYKEPCSRLYIRDKKSLLFEVTYYKRRINFEVFHVLTDGTGATEFLRELVKNYLYFAHKEEGLPEVKLRAEDVTVQDQENDSFVKYYTKNTKKPRQKKAKAYQLKKPRKENGPLQVRERILSVQEVLKRSRELGVSMTVLLSAAMIQAIHEEMNRLQEKDPVVLMVPVNLRKFFPSDSMLNFFSWIETGYHFEGKESTFADILAQVKTEFKEKLTQEKIAEHMNELIALEMHPVLKFAPAELKNLCIHAGAKFSEKNTTAIFSNMSSVSMPEEYVLYIERFGVYTSTPKMELCVCSFGDQLSLGFTSRFDTENIQRNFYRILKEQGISSRPVEEEFPETEVSGEVEMRIYKIFTFLCLAAIVFMIDLDFSYKPTVRWTLFTAGGAASMWLATTIGFFKRHNLLKNAMWQLVIVTGVSILWDFLTGWRGWSVDFVLPIVSMVILLAMVVISAVRHYPAKEYMIYLVMAAGYGLILPLILLLFGAVQLEWPSLIGIGVCFLFLIGIILFKWKEFREEMHKKFHV